MLSICKRSINRAMPPEHGSIQTMMARDFCVFRTNETETIWFFPFKTQRLLSYSCISMNLMKDIYSVIVLVERSIDRVAQSKAEYRPFRLGVHTFELNTSFPMEDIRFIIKF